MFGCEFRKALFSSGSHLFEQGTRNFSTNVSRSKCSTRPNKTSITFRQTCDSSSIRGESMYVCGRVRRKTLRKHVAWCVRWLIPHFVLKKIGSWPLKRAMVVFFFLFSSLSSLISSVRCWRKLYGFRSERDRLKGGDLRRFHLRTQPSSRALRERDGFEVD